jgi:5'-nucleotidase (lipoprotein e(P4) family)
MTHRALAVLNATLAILATNGSAFAAPPSSDDVTIASWNIEHLAEKDGEGCQPRSAADYDALRQYVSANFDEHSVIALQEVESAAAAARVFPADKFTVAIVQQEFPVPTSKCKEGSAQLRLPQRVGFAVGNAITFTQNPDLDELNIMPVGQWPLREGADITIISPSGPLRLLAVHLKSGCADPALIGENCDVLVKQIDPLERWIEAQIQAKQQFAVLGDFNRRIALLDPTFWSQVDDGTPSANLQILDRTPSGAAMAQSCPSHPGTPFIDHIVLSAGVAAQIAENSFKQLATTLSDHCAIVAKLTQQRDAHERLTGVLWFQTAAEYRIDSLSKYAQAKRTLDAALADPAWIAATEQAGASPLPAKSAVIMDLDETVLDNSPFQGELVRQRGVYSDTLWREWVAKESAGLVPGALSFIQYAQSRGVSVFFVTNREKDLEQSTRNNLTALGITLPSDIDAVLASKEQVDWTSDKTSRRRVVAQNHRILMLIGDDLGDFVTGNKAPPTERIALADKYEKFWGERWVLINNPLYGSWEAATFGSDNSKPDAQILKEKRTLVKGFKQ